MLNPHESKNYAVSFSWDKTDMSPILTTNIILTKTPHYLDLVIILMKEELYTRLLTRRPKKSKPIRPSLKAGLVQIKWKSILGIKLF
jgi:hypothetical protein